MRSEESSIRKQRILKERALDLARKPVEKDVGEKLRVINIALEKEHYGLTIDSVLEIQPFETFTPISSTSTLWIGLMNLRGEMMPIMDLRAYLNLNPFPIETFADGLDNNPKNIKKSNEIHKGITGQVIVIQYVKNIIGLLVDRVVGVEEIPISDLRSPLDDVPGEIKKTIVGLTPNLVTILDVKKILKDPKLVSINTY